MKLNTLKMKINMTVQIIPPHHSISREAMQVIRREGRVSWVDYHSIVDYTFTVDTQTFLWELDL